MEAIELSPDRTAVTLTVPIKTYRNGMVYYLKFSGIKDADGGKLEHTEAWYTVQRVPR